jgi:diguanylate cyclase (GGDEF)-like protein/PAS domain S-box-containing protein
MSTPGAASADARDREGAPTVPVRGMRARDILLHPANIVPFAVYPLYVIARRYGFVSPHAKMWLLVGTIALAHFGSTIFALAFPPGSPRAKPRLHLALEIALIGFAIYVTGWGALLAVGFVFSSAGHMGVDGARLGRTAIMAAVVTIVAGEAAVALGWFPRMLSPSQTHGLALLECAGVVFAIWMLTFTQNEKEKVELSLRQSEERLQALVRHASDAIMVLDADYTVIYVSPAVERLLGFEPALGQPLSGSFVDPEHVDIGRGLIGDLGAGDVGWVEIPLRHADGTYRWFEVGVTNLLTDPAVHGLVCNMRDVTERRSSQEALTFQAHHDALTRLPNRWRFLEELERAQQAAGSDRYVAVLFLDVDRFKLVNDSLGHEVGDRMLVAVSERLEACLRPGDAVARFGGDEFTVLLTGLSDADVALRVADRIIEGLREPITVDGRDLFLSASIGIALSRGGVDRASDLLRQADLAMYVAKEKGRGRWELFDASLAPHVMERLELEGDLWRALDHGELVVHFQPEVVLKTGEVIGAEALLRWMHPTKGELMPARFVPFAEESSLIVAIDRFVLREAARWAKRWSVGRETPLVVSVNLSPRFMRQSDVVNDVMNVLREVTVDPRLVQIEITERSALTDLETTCAQLHELRSIGVRVAIDDFGTGYSSLSYLKQLPIDVLKLDKSFVDGLEGAPSDLAIVQAIVTMGHALGVRVTAEGVEGVEQAIQLRDLGCDSAMGWLWSQALPPEQLAPCAAAGFAPNGGTRDGVVVPLRRAQ